MQAAKHLSRILRCRTFAKWYGRVRIATSELYLRGGESSDPYFQMREDLPDISRAIQHTKVWSALTVLKGCTTMSSPLQVRMAPNLLPFHKVGKPLLRPLKPIASVFGYALRAWQTSVGLYAVLAGLVLVINVILTIWLSVSFSSVNGLTTIMKGDCSKVSDGDTWIHLAINSLSILLLSGSSYTMQCLVAPTRQEVDKAHAAGSWLDIGVPSVRNLMLIDRRRTMAWFMLAISSVPLAFL